MAPLFNNLLSAWINPIERLSPVLWLDPYDKSTLFQDAAGTTPVTADGDPVGLWMDKSGNSNHFSQSTTAAKPTYRESGGLAWLEFDGVDDSLLLSGALVKTSQVTVIAGGSVSSAATDQYLLNQNRTTLNSFRVDMGSGRSKFGSVGATGSASASTAISLSTPYIQTGIGDTENNTSTLRIDGTQEGSNPTVQGGGAYTGGDTAIGRLSSSESRFFDGNSYGFIVYDRVLTIPEIEAGEQYMAGKTGVPL